MWPWILIVAAVFALGGAIVALAVPVGQVSDSNCGWAWEAIGRRDTPVCDGPGWRRLGVAALLLLLALVSAVIARRRKADASL